MKKSNYILLVKYKLYIVSNMYYNNEINKDYLAFYLLLIINFNLHNLYYFIICSYFELHTLLKI